MRLKKDQKGAKGIFAHKDLREYSHTKIYVSIRTQRFR